MFRRNVNIFNIKKKKIYLKSRGSCGFSSNIKGNEMYLNDNSFIRSLIRYIGQTITIFTTSGGQSGLGFTGLLLEVNRDYIKILIKAASPPSCCLGNCCTAENQEDTTIKNDCENITLGVITNIPLDKIAAFVHNTI